MIEMVTRSGRVQITTKPMGITVQHGADGTNLFIVESDNPEIPEQAMITRIGKRLVLDTPSVDCEKTLLRERPPFKIEYVYRTLIEKEEKFNAMDEVPDETMWEKMKRYISQGSYYFVHFATIPFCVAMGIMFFGLFINKLVAFEKACEPNSYCDTDPYLQPPGPVMCCCDGQEGYNTFEQFQCEDEIDQQYNGVKEWNSLIFQGVTIIMMAIGFFALLIGIRRAVLVFDVYCMIYGLYIFLVGTLKDISNAPKTVAENREVENILAGIMLIGAATIRFKYWWWKHYPRLTPEDRKYMSADV